MNFPFIPLFNLFNFLLLILEIPFNIYIFCFSSLFLRILPTPTFLRHGYNNISLFLVFRVVAMAASCIMWCIALLLPMQRSGH